MNSLTLLALSSFFNILAKGRYVHHAETSLASSPCVLYNLFKNLGDELARDADRTTLPRVVNG